MLKCHGLQRWRKKSSGTASFAEGRADYGSLSRVVLTGTTKQINQTTAKHGDFQGAIQERSGKFVSGAVPHPDRWDFDPQRASVDYSGVNIRCKAKWIHSTSGMFELLNKEIGTNVSCLIDNPG